MSWIKDRIKERDGREQKTKQTTAPTAASPKTTTQKDQRPQPAPSGQAGASSPSWIRERIQERQENQQRAAQREAGRALKLMTQDAANATRDRFQDTVYGWNSMFKSAADREGERAAREAERFERDRKLYQDMAASAGKTGYTAMLDRAQAGIAERAKRWQDAADSYQAAAAKEREDYLNGLKESNKSAWYGETLSREQIEGQLRQLEQRKAEADRASELATEAARNDPDRAKVYSSQAGDGKEPWYMKALWNANAQKEEIDAEIARYQAALKYREQAEQAEQDREYLAAAVENPAFEAAAKMGRESFERDWNAHENDPKTKGKEKNANLLSSVWGGSVDMTLPTGTMQQSMNAMRTGNYGLDSDELRRTRSRVLELDEDLQEIFYYWYARDNDAALRFLDTAERQQRDRTTEKLQSWAGEHPVLGTLAARGVNLISGADYLSALAEKAATGEIGRHQPNVNVTEYRDALHQGVQQKIDNDLGKFLYDVGASLIDSTIARVTGNTVPMFFLSAASSEYLEARNRGASDEQALLSGTMAGIAECVFEEVSVEKLLKQNAGEKLLLRVIKQSFTEASEEVTTSLANTISDVLLSRAYEFETKTEARQRELIVQGVSANEAKKQAEKEWAKGILRDAASGALSGGLSTVIHSAPSTVKSAANRISTAIENRRNGKSPAETVQESKSPEELDAYEEARQTAELALAQLDNQALEEQFRAADEALYNAEQGGDPVEIQRALGAYDAARDETNRRSGERETGNRILRSAQNDGTEEADSSPAAQNDGTENETREVYQETLRETADQIRDMDDGDLRAVAASVEQNLTEFRDSADPVELARMEGQLDAMRREISRREAVSRNGERLARATAPAALTGKVDEFAADWNGSRETEDADPSTPLQHEVSPLGRSAQNDRRADVGIGPYGNQTEGGLNYGEYQQGGRQRAVPTDGQRTERAEQGPADGGQRDAGLGAGGQTGSLGESTGGQVARSGGTSELRQLRNQIRALEAEKRSAAQIGVSFGTKNENLRVVPEELYTSAMREEQARAEENGVRLTFVAGGAIELRGKGGRIITADGLHQVDADGAAHIFARADSKRFSPEQLTRHEDFHNIAANNRGLLLDMVEALYEEQGEEGVARMVDAYVVALDGCYGAYTEGMSEDAQRELAMLYIEEIFADQYAGMNRSSTGARQAVETAGDVAQRFAGDIENARQNRAGIERRNGPGTRFAFAGQNKGLPQATINSIQQIGEKSVNQFSSQEIQTVEPLARQYWNEMGTKSPFFRAWFGDWRQNDDSPVSVAKTAGSARGVISNDDTGWDINISGQVFNETNAHQASGNRGAVPYLPYIEDIVKKAILLDTNGMRRGKAKSQNSLLMHSLYAVADIGNGPEVLKLYVEEMNTPGSDRTAKRAYQLQNIEKAFAASVRVQGLALSSITNTTNAISTVADLFDAVKRYDPKFQPNVPSKIVDPDGNPLQVYHGTESDFTVFDPKKTRSRMDIQGMFFSPWEIDAAGYGSKVGSYFLNIKNPAPEHVAMRVLNRYKNDKEAGSKARDALIRMGYDGVDMQGSEFIAFSSNQVKSATDNIGTFDTSNHDVRFSPSEDAGDSWGVDWLDGSELETTPRGEGSNRWSDLRGRVSEMNERQRRSLVAEAAELNNATWREEGLGIKPYSGDLADTEAVLRYVDDAVAAVKSEPGSAEYDPSFDLEALPRNEGSGLRFSAAEDDGVDWLDGSELEEMKGETATAPAKSPEKAESSTPTRTGETDSATPLRFAQNDKTGDGRQIAGATEGNGGRSMSAPTEERGRQGAVPTEESYAEQAREKKAEIAEKASDEGLKSRIKTAEERLKALKTAEKMGLVTDAAKQQDLQRRIADTQETVDILKEALDRKKAARTAEKADQAKKAEARAQRKAEKLAAQKEAELRDNRPRQARKEFRQDALNLFSVPAAKREALGQALNRFADKVIHQGSVTEQDRRTLFTSLYEAGVETIQADEYYKNIRDFARGGRVYVPESVRSEFGDDWDAFRKRAWGNGIYLTNDQNDRGADVWNVELAEMFPGSFDAQETDSRTILEGIVELAEEGKAEHVSIEEMMLRNQQETGVSVDEQMDELERKVDALIDTFAQKAELEIKLRKAGTMQLVKERQKNREIAARQAQRKKENDTRNQVMKQLQDLNRMRKKSAPEIQRQIDEIIGNLDVMARSISPEGLENLQALARKYAEAKEDPNFIPNAYVEQRLSRLEKVQLDSMEISDVIELGRTVSALVKSVTEDKRLLTDAREREISEAARDADREIKSSEGSKGGKLRDFLGNEHLSPTREIQRLGGWVRGGIMERLSRALEDGGTRRMDYQRRATRIFDRFVADKANQKWLQKAQGKDAEWIKVKVPTSYVVGEDGRTGMGWTELEITPMMRVGLLMHSRNLDNLRHIQTGGIVIPNKEQYIKGNLAEADAKGTRVKLQPETVRAIVKDCTAQERAFAKLLEKYYDGFSKDRINEVSMLVDGFERAGGDHYYQIKVSRKFLAAQPEQIQKNMALDSIGSIVNERVHAGNPIILEDASTALTGHIDLISKYYGYTAAIRDFNAVMNYTFHEKGTTKDGQEYTANAFAGSVKETLGAKWGAGAGKYLDDLLANLQQKSSINETAAQVMAKLRGNLAAASLTLNPAVALSQTASLPGAVQVLGFDGLVAAMKPEKVDMGLVEKYSPVLWYRNQGNSTQELGDYMATKGMGDSLPWWANWIQKMDSWTIRRLWAGAEYRVSKDTDLSPGSKEQIDAGEDAYYQEVARVFQRAVYDTQPNYSEMQRPAILRSKSDLTKALTMYKTVPLQYYNMMYEAVGRLRADAARAKADPANKHYQSELQKSKAFLTKTFAGVLGANVTYVVMKALVKGLLGGKKDKYLDEEGKLDAGKIFGNLGKDLLDTYAGSVIFGSEMVSLLEKYVFGGNAYNKNTFEISFLSNVNSVFAELQTLRDKLVKEDYRGGLGAAKDLAKQIAMVCGIPAQNVETYLLGITKLISPEWADRYENLFDEFERGDLKGKSGRDLRAAFRVLMDNRTDGLKDETVEELVRLWGNGQTVQVPSAIPSDFTIDNEKRVLSASERSRYRDIWNQTVSGSLEALIATEAYQNADDKDKARMIKKLYDYAGQLAKEAVTEAEAEPWVKLGQACADAGLSLEDYLTVAAVNKDKLKDMDGMELDAAIEAIMRFRVGEIKGENLDELGRLWAAGATKAIPGDLPTEIKVNGEEQKLTPEERAAWLMAWKQTAGEGLDSVMGSKLYQDADDKGKEKMLGDFYTMAKAMANAAVKPEYEASDRWITAGIEAQKMGVPIDEYVLCYEQLSNASSAKNKIQILKEQGWDDRQKEKVWLEALASETQAKKYENLKNGGASWADAMTVMDIGGDATEGLTEVQTKVYNQRWEEITANTTKRLMQTQAYKKATAEGKEALVDKLNAYASAVAKAEATKTASKEAWVNAGISATKAGVKLEEYVVFTNQLSKIDGKDENGESVDGLARNRELALLNATGWTDKQKEIVFLESGMTNEESVKKEKALRAAGLTWMQTSDVMGTVGSTTDKAYAVINSGASDDVVYKALEVYLDGSTLRTAQVGINYRVDLKYWASARKEASTDGNNSVNQEEATAYIDNLNLGWEDKAYLWQMVCYSSKWMKNPYSTTLGKEIWHDLHPEG